MLLKSGILNFLEPSGHLGPVMGLIYLFLPFTVGYGLAGVEGHIISHAYPEVIVVNDPCGISIFI